VAAALTQAGLPAITGAALAAGRDGTDLTVRLLLGPAPGARQPDSGQPAVGQPVGQPDVGQQVQQAAEAVAARLGGRLRRGIGFSAAVPAARPHG
jgi:hypothetical protein